MHRILWYAAAAAALLLAACGGGGGGTVPHANPTPTATASVPALPTPSAGSTSQNVTPSASAPSTVTLASTGGIASTITVPQLTSGSGTLAVTVATGASATMSRVHAALLRHPLAMAGGPYLAQIDFVPSQDMTLSGVPGFSLDLTQYATSAGFSLATAAAYLQSQTMYAGIVDDAGNFNVVGPLTINATSTALAVTYTGQSVSVTMKANAHYTIGVHVGPITAPTSSPAPTPSATPTASPTVAPTATPSATPTPVASPSISMFSLGQLSDGSMVWPLGITTDASGNAWFAEQSTGAASITSITPSGTVTPHEYTFGAGIPPEPTGIAIGSDGNIYVTGYCGDGGGGDVDVFSSSGVYQRQYLIHPPNTSVCGSPREQILAGTDGNLWLAEGSDQKIASMTTGGSFTEYTVPLPPGFTGGTTQGVTNGPGGRIWFIESLNASPSGCGNSCLTDSGGLVGEITSTGQVVTYALNSGEVPASIATGSDGNLWISFGGQALGIAKVTPSGLETDYVPPTKGAWGGLGIAAGADGNVWFGGSNVVGVINPATASISTIPITSQCAGTQNPIVMTSAPATRTIWFTTSNSCVGKIVFP